MSQIVEKTVRNHNIFSSLVGKNADVWITYNKKVQTINPLYVEGEYKYNKYITREITHTILRSTELIIRCGNGIIIKSTEDTQLLEIKYEDITDIEPIFY